MIIAAAHVSGVKITLSTQFVFTTLVSLASLAVAWFTYIASVPKRRITYGMPVSAQLINQSVIRSVARPDLRILWSGEELDDPHVVEIDLAYRGRKILRSEDFDQGRPFCIKLRGARIIDLLEKDFNPAEDLSPKVAVTDTALQVGPALLRRRHAMTFIVLTDGECTGLEPSNPLDAKVQVKSATRYTSKLDAEALRYRWSDSMVMKILSWAIVLFIIFYVATEPTGAAGFVRHIYNGLHDAANSMAEFVNSL
jgi:uncharacterized protein (DUF486 family)